MKTILPFLALALAVGALISYSVPKQAKFEEIETAESVAEVAYPDLSGEVAELKSRLEIVLKENESLQAKLQDREEVVPVKSEEQIKQDLVDSIIQKTVSNMGDQHWKQFNSIVKKMNLTPEQLEIAKSLWAKEIERRALTIGARNLLSQDELKAKYPELMDFNFRREMQNILTEEQKTAYQEWDQERRQQGAEQMSVMLSGRYQLSERGGFSETESTQINDAVKKAFQGRMEIPEPIEKLDISNTEKRLLTSCYNHLSPELFEKVYKKITGDG